MRRRGRAIAAWVVPVVVACNGGGPSPRVAAPDAAVGPPVDASVDAAIVDAGGPASDGAAADAQARGLAIGAGASYSTSANYRMVWTLGEGPADNAASASAGYRLGTGVAAVTGDAGTTSGATSALRKGAK